MGPEGWGRAVCAGRAMAYCGGRAARGGIARHRGVGMNASAQMEAQEVLRVKLEVLRREHRDLDDSIRALQETGRADALQMQRLKKRKLALKDAIALIEDKLLPDIIA